jgi:TPR repeat protein
MVEIDFFKKKKDYKMILDQEGEPEKDLRLGQIFYEGKMVTKNLNEAGNRFKASWEGGNMKGGYNYAYMLYKKMIPCPVDVEIGTIFKSIVCTDMRGIPKEIYLILGRDFSTEDEQEGYLINACNFLTGKFLNEANFLYGEFLLKRFRYGSASQFFQSVVDNEEDEKIKNQATERLGICKYELGDISEALKDLTSHSEKKMAESNFYIARILHGEKGKSREVEDHLLLAAKSDHQEAIKFLVDFYINGRYFDKAREWAPKIKEQDDRYTAVVMISQMEAEDRMGFNDLPSLESPCQSPSPSKVKIPLPRKKDSSSPVYGSESSFEDLGDPNLARAYFIAGYVLQGANADGDIIRNLFDLAARHGHDRTYLGL